MLEPRRRRWAWLLAAAWAAAAPGATARAHDPAPLRFLGNKNIPPVVYLEDGTPTGVAVELVRALSRHLPRPVDIEAMEWPLAQDLVLEGAADALIQINPSAQRRALYDFSEPLLESRFSVFVRKGVAGLGTVESLRGVRVGVEKGGLPQQVLSEDGAIGLVTIPDFLQGFRMLAADEVDALVVDERVGSYVIAKHGIRDVTITGHPLARSWSAIAVRKGNAELLGAVDAALRRIKADGTYQRVLDRWEPKEVVFWTREQLVRAAMIALAALLLLTVLWAAALSRALKRRKLAERTLGKQNAVLGGIINAVDAIVFSTDREYRYTSFNDRHAEVMRALYGAEIARGASMLGALTNAGDREIARRNLDRALAGEQLVEEAYSGEEGRARRCFRVAHSPVRSAGGDVIGVAVLAQDITERKQSEQTIRRINRELRALTSANKTLMRASDEVSLLRNVCRIVCEEAGYRMAWVGYRRDDEGKTVSPIAWAGVEEGYLAEADITWGDAERGHGPAGTAIRTGRITCVQDFETEPGGAPWRLAALRRGYRSATALPLADARGRTFGALCIYSTEPGAFTPDERRLLEELASDLAFGLMVLRARTELEHAEAERSAHLHFLESMDRVNRAIAGATDLERTMGDVLDAVLAVFDCDRAFLLYPCDPAAPTCRSPVERFRPGHPGLAAVGVDLAVTTQVSETFRIVLAAEGPVSFGPGSLHPLPGDVAESFGIQSIMCMAIRPKVGHAWLFGLHQCSRARTWTADEHRLLQEIGRRVADALSTVLVVRDLRESEARLAKAEQMVHVGYWEVDLGAGEIVHSEEACRLYGMGPSKRTTPLDEWRARWRSLVHPDDRARAAAAIEAALETGARYDVEYRIVLPDGTMRFLHSQGDLTRDESGRPRRMLGTMQDITERKRAEEALRRSEEQYRRIVETAHEGIWVIDAEGRTRFANRQMAQMLGCCVEEMVGTRFTEFMDEEARVAGEASLERRRRGIAEQHEFRFRRRDGSDLWALVETTPLFDESGTWSGALAMLTDITERRAIEAQLRQSQKLEAVGRLAGGVAHDFNNLLTAILGSAGEIAEGLGSTHPLHVEATEIEGAARKAAVLTGQLLAFGRKQPMAPQVVDLGDVVQAMDRMLRRLIGEDVELVTVVRPGLGRVRVDPVQLEQVVLNLAVNARDAMPSGGRLVIEAANVAVTGDDAEAWPGAAPGRYVMLAVRDSGVGMSPDVLAHIFEPFFTTKELGKGTGLGLATVYGIVKQAGGDVHVRSEPGQGTSFEVLFPRVDAPAEASAAGAAAREAPRGTETLLVVEDEPLVRSLAVRVLKGAGYRVLDAGDAEQALRLLATSDGSAIDLLMTDVVMPHGSGPDLAARLRAERPGLPVLFSSGYADRAGDGRVELGPLTGFIPKPFTSAELASKVRELLDAREPAGSIPAARP